MYIVIDIGGTKTRVARSDDLSTLSEPVIFDTPQEYSSGVAKIIDTVKAVAGHDPIMGVSVGVPGSVSPDKKQTYNRTNLKDWSQRPLANDIASALAVPTGLENDTALVGLGEAVFGAGKDADIVVYMTVSTGVNGVRIVNKKIDVSAMGFEIGGQYTPFSKETTFEHLVSGRDIENRFGKPPRELGKEWDGWDELALITAYALNNTVLHWSPHKVVLGGSMFNEIGIAVPRVEEHLKHVMQKFELLPPIVHSELGDVGGLYGGLAILRH